MFRRWGGNVVRQLEGGKEERDCRSYAGVRCSCVSEPRRRRRILLRRTLGLAITYYINSMSKRCLEGICRAQSRRRGNLTEKSACAECEIFADVLFSTPEEDGRPRGGRRTRFSCSCLGWRRTRRGEGGGGCRIGVGQSGSRFLGSGPVALPDRKACSQSTAAGEAESQLRTCVVYIDVCAARAHTRSIRSFSQFSSGSRALKNHSFIVAL